MTLIELLNIIGFKEYTVVNNGYGYNVTYIFNNYKLIKSGNIEDDENNYTFMRREDGEYSVMDLFGRKVDDRITELGVDIGEYELTLILKEEFNHIIRKYKINKLNN